MLAVMEQSFLSLSHAVAASLKESALSGCLCLLTQRSEVWLEGFFQEQYAFLFLGYWKQEGRGATWREGCGGDDVHAAFFFFF